MTNAGVAHLVERRLAKAEVAGSSPVSRSIWHHSQAVRQRSAKPLFPGPIPGGASMYKPLKRYLRQKARSHKGFRAFFMLAKM